MTASDQAPGHQPRNATRPGPSAGTEAPGLNAGP